MTKQKEQSILPTYLGQEPIDKTPIFDTEQTWRTCRYRTLFATLLMFLGSLWIVSTFSGPSFDVHAFDKYRDNAAAMAAAGVMGDSGEEGIHSLEVEIHSGNTAYDHLGHTHSVHDDDYYYYYAEDYDDEYGDYYGDDDDDWEIGFEDKLEREIYDIIDNYPIVIFSKTYCPYSLRAKSILAQYGVTPYVIEVDTRDDSEDVKFALFKLTYQATFPNVFIDGESIGGSEELAFIHKSGYLRKLLIHIGEIAGEVV